MSTSNTENDQLLLELHDSNEFIDQPLEYEVNEHFLSPCAGWTLSLAADPLSETTKALLIPGASVRLTCNGHPQLSGYIDGVSKSAARGSGTLIRLHGRDKLGQAVRGGADPKVRFTEATNLHDALAAIFAPFGYKSKDIIVSDLQNRRTITGANIVPLAQVDKELRKFKLHKTVPYPGEGAYAFAARIANRFGLWIWAGADGHSIVVGAPDFDQAPLASLTAKEADRTGFYTNILDAESRVDTSNQASLMVVEGWSAGKEFDSGHMACIVYNELCCTDARGELLPEVEALAARYPHARKIPLRSVFSPQMRTPHRFVHAVYRVDQESQTPEQLESFARREMSLMQRDQFTYGCTVEGHTSNGPPWAVNTVVDVNDDFRDVHEPLWIMGRTLTRSMTGGCTTRLDCIRRHTLEFGL